MPQPRAQRLWGSDGRLWAWAGRIGHGQKERPLLRALYRAAVGAEAAMARAVAARHGVEAVDPGNLTWVVKTFERPRELRRMLASVRRVFSGPIIVADDSATTFSSTDPNLKVLALPFDSGVGAGRNALIDAVATEYLLMSDDDMIVLPDLDVRKPLDYLRRNPGVSLYGGRVVKLPQWTSADYSIHRLYAYQGPPREPQGTIIDGLPVYYKVPNFYVARTSEVREVRYDDRLKRVDHNDFFTTACGRLLCVYDAAWVALHAHSLFDPHYQAFRMNQHEHFAHLASKWFAG